MRKPLPFFLLLSTLLLLPAIAWVAVAQDPRESREAARLSRASPHVFGSQSLVGGAAFRPAVSAARQIVFGSTGTPERFNQHRQSLAPLAGGGFGVVWDAGSFGDRDVRMQWLRPDGSFLFPPGGDTITDLGVDEVESVIVAHPTAGAFVAFLRLDAGSSQVMVQSFDETGAPRWPGSGVAASDLLPDEAQVSPKLLANAAGGVFVCFESIELAGGDDLRCQLLDETGERRWTLAGQSVGATGWLVLPQMLGDGAGGLLVFWRNQGDSDNSLGPMLIQGQRFSPTGQPLWGASAKVIRTTRLAESNFHSYRVLQAVSDGQGGAVLAFDDWTGRSAGGLDVLAQRVSSEGTPLWGEERVVIGANGRQQHEATIAAGDGGAFVATIADLSILPTRLLLFRLGPDGKHLWPKKGVLVAHPKATALDYGLEGSCDDGVLRLIWTHQRAPGSTDFDIRLAGYTLNGKRWGGAAGVSLTTSRFGHFSRGLAYASERREILAIWDDVSSGTWNNTDARGAMMADDDWRP